MHDICTTLADMKTRWLASRELSAHPGRALAAVGRSGRVLVTANGKPRAIMIPTSEATFSRETTEHIRRMVHGAGHPVKTVPMDVFAMA